MKVEIELGDDVIEIKKSKLCCIKECNEYATENLCTLGMCKKHHNQMKD